MPRGGSAYRRSRKPQIEHARALDKHLQDTRGQATSRLSDVAPFFRCAEGIGETTRDHIIPRKSLTDQQHLRIWPNIQGDEIMLRSWQHDKSLGRTVEVSNPVRVNTVVDRDLLDQSLPEAHLGERFSEGYVFKRVTSRSKQIERKIEQPTTSASKPLPLGPEYR